MTLRQDIPEGADYADMPKRVGYGRIHTPFWVTERYVTLRLFGFRLFLVRHQSRMPVKDSVIVRCWRGWIRRESATAVAIP